MAIQVSGSTVIHDSQDVQVSGMFTASSFVGDASQLTNLPASGGTLEATASGTLADGSKVIINTDGTVSVVAESETTGPGVGSEEVFESASTFNISSVYDPSNNKVVITYRDAGNSGYGTAIVGAVSGNSITFGTPVLFESSGEIEYTSVVYDSTNSKIVIAYKNYGNSGYGTAIVGTVSGTSINFGSSSVFESASISHISAAYDSSNQKVVIAYRDNPNSNQGTAIVGEVSGTSISFPSSPVIFESGNTIFISTTYDSTNQKVVISYADYGNSGYGTAIVGEVSGTSISFPSSPVLFQSAAAAGYISSVYDSTNQKVVISYQDTGNNFYGTAVVGTVSGTSINFGTPVIFDSNAACYFCSSSFDSTNGKVVIAFRDDGNSEYGTLVAGTVSGNSINFGSKFVFNSANTQNFSPTFDSTNGKVVIAYHDKGNSEYGTAIVYGNTGFPVPQLGSATVFESAQTEDTSAVYDSNSNKVVIAYQDTGNSRYGTAIVGTVSGTSISFGSPTVFESAATHMISTTFDSSNNKVVITYYDNGNSNYGTAIVGTVSGTDISFGTPTVFNSNATTWPRATFDSSNGKVVIAYRNEGNSGYGTAIVGTVSGTSISFGSPVVYEYANTRYGSPVYDSANSKIVISYRDDGNSNRGTAIVGTVSGTSISFGTPALFNSSSNTQDISSVYDSVNGKVVVVYRDGSNSNYSTAVVGEVSGTSISFGTPVVYETVYTFYMTSTYDSTNGKIVIAYRDPIVNYGKTIVGTVSGTSINFGSPVIYEYAVTQYNSATYDSTNDKVVIAYQDNGNSSYGTAVAFSPVTKSSNLTAENFIGISEGAYSNGQTATIQVTGSVDDAQSGLTAGQAYYVQDNGTLGESGSVFAGTAVSASKIIVKG